jgi:hypothetical protein
VRYHGDVIAVHWILFSLFMSCFVYIAGCNIIGLLRATPEHGYSMGLLVGGACCAIALMVVPAPISVGGGCLPILILAHH